MTEFRHLGDRLVHQGSIWHVVVASFESPDGERFERDIVRSPGAVAAVPIIFGDDGGDPEVVLIAQYRPPYDRVVLEIPAGMRDVEGEPTAATAGRELIEEVGLEAANLELLIEMYPSPGMTDSVTTIYLATDCQRAVRAPHGPEEHSAEVVTMTLSEAATLVERGRISDAKSVAGILLAERRLRTQTER